MNDAVPSTVSDYHVTSIDLLPIDDRIVSTFRGGDFGYGLNIPRNIENISDRPASLYHLKYGRKILREQNEFY